MVSFSVCYLLHLHVIIDCYSYCVNIILIFGLQATVQGLAQMNFSWKVSLGVCTKSLLEDILKVNEYKRFKTILFSDFLELFVCFCLFCGQ